MSKSNGQPVESANGSQPHLCLQAAHVQKTYSGRRVVDDVSVSVCEGEIVGLLGANGAGKTTTFYILVGLENTEHGNVTLMGQDVTSLPMYFVLSFLRSRSYFRAC